MSKKRSKRLKFVRKSVKSSLEPSKNATLSNKRCSKNRNRLKPCKTRSTKSLRKKIGNKSR